MDLDRYRQPTRNGPTCLVGKLLGQLDDSRADLLRAVLDDPDVMWIRVEEHSQEDFGTTIPANTASRHARGRCACG